MEKIKIVYIDDSPDTNLDEYFDKNYQNAVYEYSLVFFNPTAGYESLLEDIQIQTANIIFIDSRLFENQTTTGEKFSGEEFKLVLKKFYPFIEVIVITQNEVPENISMIAKYDPDPDKTPLDYYGSIIPPCIERATNSIKQYQTLAIKLNENTSWEVILKEKVMATLNGTNIYDELTKTDIDTLVAAFKEIQVNLDA